MPMQSFVRGLLRQRVQYRLGSSGGGGGGSGGGGTAEELLCHPLFKDMPQAAPQVP